MTRSIIATNKGTNFYCYVCYFLIYIILVNKSTTLASGCKLLPFEGLVTRKMMNIVFINIKYITEKK